MTREEAAIKSCEDRIKHLESAPPHHYGKRQRERAIELEKVKIKALRPVSREKVEKWRGEWVSTGVISCKCSKCNKWMFKSNAHEYNFCPYCMAPVTDEAVDMVMGRLEALNDAN